ncbi:Oidioi.mRNA.OKI2018_I69.chr2.g4301.t1.cds [Oikopleura dioica]|uniref:Oidioi.mRNA.OKI2018_I69.chr2.g4301.t1.cds n=1 Tax=Oikopleura dioica TaxID=34765 RepID=A0ABN7T0D6_OIKDI|nr:Oidioi.mRNA.OKI2018_I69.chr2.g4301.t1.cds [Oikopleura dioica]
MKYLKRNTGELKQYTPVKQQRKDGNLFVVPCGRPIQAASPKELEKKMKNRASALEARKRAKQKEADLERRFLELELENEIQRTINMRLKALIEKYTSRTPNQPKEPLKQPLVAPPPAQPASIAPINHPAQPVSPLVHTQPVYQDPQIQYIEKPISPPAKYQPLETKDSFSEYFSNIPSPVPNGSNSGLDSAGHSTTSSICSLPPSPENSPKFAKKKLAELSPPVSAKPPKPTSSCLETCPMDDFEDSLEFLFGL